MGAKEKGVWGRSSVGSTFGQVADGGILLLWPTTGVHCATSAEETYDTVWEKGKSS